VLPLQWAQLTKTVHTARLGREFVFVFFGLLWFIFMFMCVLFYLGKLSHFLSCFGADVTNLNEPPSSFLLPPPLYCGLGAGSIPLRAIVNKKQCETMGLFMSLVIHYWCTRLPGCIRLRNDLYCVEWGVIFYSLTHSLTKSNLTLTWYFDISYCCWRFSFTHRNIMTTIRPGPQPPEVLPCLCRREY